MAAVTVCSDFGTQEKKGLSLLSDLSFLNAEFQASFSPSSFNLIKRHLSSS